MKTKFAIFLFTLAISQTSGQMKNQKKERVGRTEKENVEKEWLWIDELSINSPLQTEKRFLGWYVDGEWKVDNKELCFLNFTGKSSLITNNLVVKGNDLQFAVSFEVQQDMSVSKSIESPISNTEVIVFDFSNRIYDIKVFESEGTIADLSGYSLFFFRRKGKQIVYLKQMFDQNSYNLQMIFDEVDKINPSLYCKYEYLNNKTDLNVTFDFEQNLFQVKLNESPCISFRIDERLFPTPKATMSILGYSSSLSPIKILIKKIAIAKTASQNLNDKPFHSDMESLLKHVNTYDNLYQTGGSLTNVMQVQGKTKAEIEKMSQLIELLAQRSKKIDDLITGSEQNKDMFKIDEKYEAQLGEVLSNINDLQSVNTEMKNRFSILEEKFEEFQNVEGLGSGLNEVEELISWVSSMLTVYKFRKLLKEIGKFSKVIDKNTISQLNIEEIIAKSSSSNWELIVKSVAGCIVLIILVLVFLIIRAINYGVKNHIF